SGARTRSASLRSSWPVSSPSRTVTVGVDTAPSIVRWGCKMHPTVAPRDPGCKPVPLAKTRVPWWPPIRCAAMARARRKAAATLRLNLEIAGLAALGAAVLLALALAIPKGSGAVGWAVAHETVYAFGAAAWALPLVIAVIGAIVFLEINVPQMIASFGFA